MYHSRNENLVPLPSLWTKSFFLSPHLPIAISCLKSSYTHYMKCHSKYLSQVKVHLQLGDSFKGVISIKCWIPLGDIRIPAIKLITLRLGIWGKDCTFLHQTRWHVAPAFSSGELLLSNCELDFWRGVGGEHRHLLDLHLIELFF